jgi:hypothetical protein
MPLNLILESDNPRSTQVGPRQKKEEMLDILRRAVAMMNKCRGRAAGDGAMVC